MMKIRSSRKASIVASIGLCLGLCIPMCAQSPSTSPTPVQKEKALTSHASGTFEVKLNPQTTEDPGLGRMSIDKQFHGDLEGTSQGEMLSAVGNVKGSAGYVAIERVTGTLQGRKGSFVLQHNATMTRGTPQMNIIVVPDSGTDQLVGLVGTLTIKIDNGKHFYDFDYTLSETR